MNDTEAPEQQPQSSPGGNTNNQITVRGGNQDQPASLEADTLGFKPYVEAVFRISGTRRPRHRSPCP